MVTTDDEVGGAEVLTDDGVPDGFSGTTHAHGKGQKGKGSHAVRVSVDDGLVNAHTGESVDITRLGQTNDRVNEDVGLVLSGSAHGQLAVSSVHGVAGLEGDDLAPSHLLEEGSGLSRRV